MKKSFNSRKAFILYVVSMSFFIIAALYLGGVYCNMIKLLWYKISVLEGGGYKLAPSWQFSLEQILRTITYGTILIITAATLVLFINGLWKKLPRYISAVLITFVLFTMPNFKYDTMLSEFMAVRYPLGMNLNMPGDLYDYAFSIKYILWGVPLVLLLLSFLTELITKKQISIKNNKIKTDAENHES